MLPINRLPIKTRSEDVFPHVRSRWVRAGGTSWAHQAPSITLWQEPLEHGGASVEPQVKCVGWAVFLMHSKGMYRCHICIQALYVTRVHAACVHGPHISHMRLQSHEVKPCWTHHLHNAWALSLKNFHPADMFHPCTRDLCLCTYHTSVNRKQEVRKKWCLWFWQSLRASWVWS